MTDPDDTTNTTTGEGDQMARTQAWGHVKKTKQAAIDDAVDELGKLASSTGQTQVGREYYDEVRPTPTGYQARVSARMQPRDER